jgi:hypothetical protein
MIMWMPRLQIGLASSDPPRADADPWFEMEPDDASCAFSCPGHLAGIRSRCVSALLVERLLAVVVVEHVHEASELGQLDSPRLRCAVTCRLLRCRGELALVVVDVTWCSATAHAWHTMRVRGCAR